MNNKPRLAFFSLGCCEGCQLQLTYLGDRLLEILKRCDIVSFREVISEKSDEYDVAFVEGMVSRRHDEEILEKIRGNASILVAYGSCATIGGINGLRLNHSQKEARDIVYPDREYHLEVGEPRPIQSMVDVDYYIHGCPTNNDETIEVVKCILAGRPYKVPEYPVCVECKLKENVCLFEKGQVCMGPVTRAGCGAWCPSIGNTCYICRGLLENPQQDGQMDILKKHGYTLEGLSQKFELYNMNRIKGGKKWQKET
jgi:sulfhydrogenase subunit delta